MPAGVWGGLLFIIGTLRDQGFATSGARNIHWALYLKVAEVESIAYEVLTKYCPHVLTKPCISPVAEILAGLHQNTGLLIAWEDLGCKGTAKILGKVSFRRQTLFLDVSLNSERKVAFRFTAAHEIGHWVLHRHNWKHIRLDEQPQASGEFVDDETSLCKLDQKSPRDWLEFQANVFASSMVMPRIPFQKAVEQSQRGMGITRNLGVVYLNDATYSTRDFQELSARLSHTFDVSKESVRIRLKTLQLLIDEAAKSTKSVKQLVAGVFRAG